jgi:hypothetical protein
MVNFLGKQAHHPPCLWCVEFAVLIGQVGQQRTRLKQAQLAILHGWHLAKRVHLQQQQQQQQQQSCCNWLDCELLPGDVI